MSKLKTLNERAKAGDISYWLNDNGTAHLRGDFSVTELLLIAHEMEDRLRPSTEMPRRQP